MPPTLAPPKQITYIHSIYRYYFLFFEAPMAVVGLLIILLNPLRFLTGTLPLGTLTLYPLTLTPPVRMLLTNIAFLYGMIAVLEGVVLGMTRERNVWLGIMCAMLVSDVGHVWSVVEVDRGRFARPWGWGGDEWFNYGTLLMGTGLRLGFVCGFGWR